MSLTEEAIANVVYRLRQMAQDVDRDPDLAAVRIVVVMTRRPRRVRAISIDLEREFDPAPPGVVIRESLDNGVKRPP